MKPDQYRLMQIIRSWEGTPWRSNACSKGHGVDCVRFVMAVLDEYFGVTDPAPRCHDPHLSLHDTSAVIKIAYELAHRYPGNFLDESMKPETFDVIIVRRQKNAGPGHIAIVGYPKETAWHATNKAGVSMTSVSLPHLWKIWRPERI